MDASNSAHFVMIPLMAIGTMNPMLDLARALALRGSVVTFVTTPVNAKRMESGIDHCTKTELPIQFAVIPFPCSQAGLPEGGENVDLIPSMSYKSNFLQAITLLKEPIMELLLKSQSPKPSCFITGSFFGSDAWVNELARFFGASWLIFDGPGVFSTLCYTLLEKCDTFPKNPAEPFMLQGMPHDVTITRSQLPPNLTYRSQDYKIKEKNMEYFDGIIINSFTELEMEYAQVYEAVTGKNLWMIGPLSLHSNNEPSSDVSYTWNRGNKSEIDEQQCINWLDYHKPRSVIYACFGSREKLSLLQLVELGFGLKNSNHPFVWVVRQKEDENIDLWLSEFEGEMATESEDKKAQGLVIRGWAPQLHILSHPSIGGFLTHCGWNSIIEGISAGIPMITWPYCAEQFLNEKLVVEVLEIGVSVGVKHQKYFGILVENSTVTNAVKRLMNESEEAKIRRTKAKKLSIMAKMAMDEGGSSHTNLMKLNKYAAL